MRIDDSNWLKMGKLVALRRDPGDDWRLGVVRRITRIDQEWRQIGVKFLSHRPILAALKQDTPFTLSYSVGDGGLLGRMAGCDLHRLRLSPPPPSAQA